MDTASIADSGTREAQVPELDFSRDAMALRQDKRELQVLLSAWQVQQRLEELSRRLEEIEDTLDQVTP